MARLKTVPPEQGWLFGGPPAPVEVTTPPLVPLVPSAPSVLPAGARAVYQGDAGEVVRSTCGRCGAGKQIICGRELTGRGETRDLCVACVECVVRTRVAAGEPVPYGCEWVDCTTDV